ncbi:MAG: hypothetical protein WB239_01695 [Acidimicrobiia bacterium]
MLRTGLLLAVAALCAACAGLGAGVMHGDLNSEADLSFAQGATEASGALLAFDPAQHRMDITISIQPLAQDGDMDVVIVTDSGTRYQVLGSFHRCTEEAETRRCSRVLPPLPYERVGSWRVEAMRGDASFPASVQVRVKWIPTGS